MVDETRVATLEDRVEGLAGRVMKLESEAAARVERERSGAWRPERIRQEPVAERPAPQQPAAPPRAARPPVALRTPAPVMNLRSQFGLPQLGDRRAVEDLLGGRVLAWVGGVAVLLGIVFLFAVAVSRGWIGEEARTGLGAFASTALLVLGAWLHEHKSRTDAALAAVSAGIAGLFVVVTVAAQVYELVPVIPALLLALATGAVAMTLAVRWDSRGIAALGLVGAMLAPVLVGALAEGGSVGLLFVAAASAVGVLIWRRWDWLALAAFVIATPQWVAYLFFGDADLASGLVVLVGFGLLGAGAALGYELRVPGTKLRISSTLLLVLNALVVAAAGGVALDSLGHETMSDLWIAGMAAFHLAAGLLALRHERVSREISLLVIALGVILADVAYGLIASGPVLTVGWAVSGVAFAGLMRHVGTRDDRMLAELGLGAQIALALAHTVMVDAPPASLDGDALSAAAAVSLLALASCCFVCGRIAEEWRAEARIALDAIGLAAVVYATAIALDGAALAAAWAAQSVALAGLAHRTKDEITGYGALVFLGLAAVHALAFEAPLESLVSGAEDFGAAAIALGAVGAAGFWCARGVGWLGREGRTVLECGVAITALYLASIAIVTVFADGGAVVGSALDLNQNQQGQMALSVFWAAAGLAGLVVGLRRDIAVLRAGALSLLLVAIGKVFMFDLATLTALYRVISFIVLGLMLLAGAAIWQQMRPRDVPDMREAPEGIR